MEFHLESFSVVVVTTGRKGVKEYSDVDSVDKPAPWRVDEVGGDANLPRRNEVAKEERRGVVEGQRR